MMHSFGLPQHSSLSCRRAARQSRGAKRQPCGIQQGPHAFSGTLRAGASPGATSPSPSPPPGTLHRLQAAQTPSETSPSINGNGATGALARSDYPKFVQFFRQASPYIAGHRGKTFVIVAPGNVTSNRVMFQSVMSDVALLHGLGIRLVVVVGAQNQIDQMLRERGMTPAFVGGYRVTDKTTLNIAMEAAGQVRTQCEQFLSKGPAIPMIRRHTKGEGEIHFEPALRVISGNFVTAKRRGVIDGVDFGHTGEVRFVLKDAISNQLDQGNVVLLSNLGFTAGGDVLNCNTCDVGLHAAVELGADKLFVLHTDEVAEMNLPSWLPVSDAQDLLVKSVQDSLSSEQMAQLKEAMDSSMAPPDTQLQGPVEQPTYPHSPRDAPRRVVAHQASRVASRLANSKREELIVDLDVWSASGLPTAVSTCVVACCKAYTTSVLRSAAKGFDSAASTSHPNWPDIKLPKGIKRAHLLDARLDGGLLLELYSRDGVGTMISADFYEGIRRAGPADLDAIRVLLKPLEEAGTLVARTREEVANMLPDFTVVERENKILGCALLVPLGQDAEGVEVAEVGAFCIDPAFRGSGRGDSLLDYLEQEARARGVQRLVLLTTRTADWFEQRDFKFVGPAYSCTLLPEPRRQRINPARNSQLYAKQLEASDGSEPGKRIGF